MMTSNKMTRFCIDKRHALPNNCIRCDYLFACHGECPKHRFNQTDNGEMGLSYLCLGYKLFYSHVKPYMDKMKELLMSHRAPSEIMNITL